MSSVSFPKTERFQEKNIFAVTFCSRRNVGGKSRTISAGISSPTTFSALCLSDRIFIPTGVVFYSSENMSGRDL